MWLEFIGGPQDGQIGETHGGPDVPVYGRIRELAEPPLLGTYRESAPPTFCVDRASIQPWAGKNTAAAIAAGVHKVYWRCHDGAEA